MELGKEIGLRLEEFAADQGLSKTQFAERLEEDHWFLGRLTEGSDVSARFLTKLSQAFPELNLEWILTGKGPMVQGAAPTQRSLPQELLHIEEAFRHITSKEILISDSAKAKAFEQLVELMTDLVSFLSLAQARRLDSQLAFLEIIEPKLSDS